MPSKINDAGLPPRKNIKSNKKRGATG